MEIPCEQKKSVKIGNNFGPVNYKINGLDLNFKSSQTSNDFSLLKISDILSAD